MKLSPSEVMTAAVIGVMRHIYAMKTGNKHLHGGHRDQGWQYDIEGALGECVVAKHLNLYWFAGEQGGPDVGEFEVRTTSCKKGCLILHKKDNDEARFYLVTGLDGTYEVRGWILGKDGQQEKYWSDPQKSGRDAYFVPQSALHPCQS